jgi:hypothetical protein
MPRCGVVSAGSVFLDVHETRSGQSPAFPPRLVPAPPTPLQIIPGGGGREGDAGLLSAGVLLEGRGGMQDTHSAQTTL